MSWPDGFGLFEGGDVVPDVAAITGLGETWDARLDAAQAGAVLVGAVVQDATRPVGAAHGRKATHRAAAPFRRGLDDLAEGAEADGGWHPRQVGVPVAAGAPGGVGAVQRVGVRPGKAWRASRRSPRRWCGRMTSVQGLRGSAASREPTRSRPAELTGSFSKDLAGIRPVGLPRGTRLWRSRGNPCKAPAAVGTSPAIDRDMA